MAGLRIVHGDVQAKGALSHRRPGGEDDQVGAQEAPQDLVQVCESGHDRRGGSQQEVVHGRLLLQVAVEDVPEGLEVSLLRCVADGVERVLGLSQRRAQVVGLAIAEFGYLGACRDELSHCGGAGDDLGVVLGVDGRRGVDDQVRQVGHAANQVQLLGPLQLTGERDLVYGLVPVGKGHRRVVAQLVPLPVEIAGMEHRCNAGNAVAVDQQRSYEGLFGFYVVGQ